MSANSGSTGKISEGIGKTAIDCGFDSWIAYGRGSNISNSNLIRIGSYWSVLEHRFESLFFDRQGLASRCSTKSFLKTIEQIQPDIIHLHNLHGSFINYRLLFQFIFDKDIPTVWTLHDCWPFTGHCTHFTLSGCEKWKSKCFSCAQSNIYPKSLFVDQSDKNFLLKKHSFTPPKNLTIVPVSHWLEDLVSKSFLSRHNRIVIHNGINTDTFAPSHADQIRKKHHFPQKCTILLGVANVWSQRKGLKDFIELSRRLSDQYKIILIGLTNKQINGLPHNIVGIEHTESNKELAEYYAGSDLFLNLTYEDNYPTTNLEAISCGTPCLTYQTGGSPESITSLTGFIVQQGDLSAVLRCIETIRHRGKFSYSSECRKFALEHFNEKKCFKRYINLYNSLICS